MSKFDLINNHGYKEKVEHDHTTGGEKINIAPIQWVKSDGGGKTK